MPVVVSWGCGEWVVARKMTVSGFGADLCWCGKSMLEEVVKPECVGATSFLILKDLIFLTQARCFDFKLADLMSKGDLAALIYTPPRNQIF